MLPRALEEAWVPVLDAVLSELRAPKLADTARLAPKLVALSKAYNAGVAGQEAARSSDAIPLEARVAFSFARDVPKAAGAVRELVASGALALPADRPLRILDLGAGLGAMTWGIVRALAASGARGEVTSLMVDEDAKALAAAASIARGAAMLGPQPVTLTVQTRTGRVGTGMAHGRFDVVVLGQVLSEMDRDADGEARIVAHAAVLRDLVERALEPEGSLVVVEPALRDRSRHLHAVRDRVLADANVTLFAPCLHREACPALANEGDWCHEDLAVDLPPWLVPLARAAGLRYQGLTFGYLVLRRDARSLASGLGERAAAVHLRVVSDRIVTKGKQELFGCTHEGRRVRLRLLDRDVTAANEVWTTLGRGDIVCLTAHGGDRGAPPIDERGRISPHAAIDARRITKL